MIRASTQITITKVIDVHAVYRYYKLQSSTLAKPDKPTLNPPEGWTDTEPLYVSESTNTLYFVDCNVYSDQSFSFSEVSVSSSYEAAKDAWNKANNAQESVDNLEVGARNIIRNTKKMDAISVSSNVSISEDDEGFGVASFCQTASLDYNYIRFDAPPVLLSRILNKNVTISFEVKSSDYVNINNESNRGLMLSIDTCASDDNSKSALYHNIYYTAEILSDTWTKLSKTIHITEDWFTEGTGEISTDTLFVLKIYDHSLWSMDVRKVKIEIGNLATDWSAAPEDITDDIIDAGNKANDAQNTANSAVAGISDIQSDFNVYKETVSAEFESTVQYVDGSTEVVRNWLHQGSDGINPYLELGGTASNFRTRLTNTNLEFYDDSTKLAWFGNQQMHIPNADIDDANIDQLTMGEYQVISKEGHFSIIYTG